MQTLSFPNNLAIVHYSKCSSKVAQVFKYCHPATVGPIIREALQITTQMNRGPIEMLSNCDRPLWCSLSEKRLRMMKRRRRQHLLAVCVLMVVAGGFLKSRVSHTSALQPVKGRTLLHVVLRVSSWSSSMVWLHKRYMCMSAVTWVVLLFLNCHFAAALNVLLLHRKTVCL